MVHVVEREGRQVVRMTAIQRQWMSRLREQDWITAICVVVMTAFLATLSVSRYLAYNASMFDLGHMAQALWTSTQGRPLEFTYRGGTVSRLALHAELAYFLLTPLYKLFPSPVTLLLVQSILFGSGSLPLYRMAQRRLGSSRAARIVVLVYLFCPVAQTAVLFDFHGDTLAMPLLLYMLEALDRRAWGAYGLWLALALSCKVYVAAPIAALGGFLWYKGFRRVGPITFLAGLIWGVTTYLLVRPLFAASGSALQQSSAVGYAEFYFGNLITDLSRSWLPRMLVAVVVFVPLIPNGMYALDWTSLALITALPVLLSNGPGPSYHYIHHHYAVVVPFLMLALVKAAERLQVQAKEARDPARVGRRTVTWQIALPVALMVTLLANAVLVATPLSPALWSEGLKSSWALSAYGRSSRDALKDRWLRRYVPDEVPVLASPMLAPHLARRSVLHVPVPLDGTAAVPPEELLDSAEYVVLDGLFERTDIGGCRVGYDWEYVETTLHRSDFRVVSAQDGLLLFRRKPQQISEVEWDKVTLINSVTVEENEENAIPYTTFGDAIGLIDASWAHTFDGHILFRYVWSLVGDVGYSVPIFAVTELAGVDDARVLHVPTMALYPTTEWRQGEVIVEEFEVDLPDHVAPGVYALRVGWYDSGHVHAYATDDRSRVDESAEVGTVCVGRSDADR